MITLYGFYSTAELSNGRFISVFSSLLKVCFVVKLKFPYPSVLYSQSWAQYFRDCIAWYSDFPFISIEQ